MFPNPPWFGLEEGGDTGVMGGIYGSDFDATAVQSSVEKLEIKIVLRILESLLIQ